MKSLLGLRFEVHLSWRVALFGLLNFLKKVHNFLFNVKKVKAFSLIEMLVALIILSLLTSAFVPLITKKLKARELTVGSFGTSAGEWPGIIDKCPAGYHMYQKECYPDISYCRVYESGSECAECKTGYHLEGAACLPDTDCKCQHGKCGIDTGVCATCDTGYKLYEGTCILEGSETNCSDYFCTSCTGTADGQCTQCRPGYQLYKGRCYFGSLDGCLTPKYDDTYHRINCEGKCATNYEPCDSGSCRLKSALSAPCPANMKKIGCVCVTKYNIGEGKYGEKLSSVHTCTPGSSCAPTNGTSGDKTTARNLQAACWTGKGGGKTAGTCNANYGGYDGCRRTLCNWTGGYKMCESIGMRMPTMPELVVYTNEENSSSSALTSEGGSLMFCDDSSSSVSPQCQALEAGCSGTQDGYCHPYHVWSSSFYSSAKAWDRYLNGRWYDGADYLGHGFSVRCVKDL